MKGMRGRPSEIRIVHGDGQAKRVLHRELEAVVPGAKVWVPGGGI